MGQHTNIASRTNRTGRWFQLAALLSIAVTAGACASKTEDGEPAALAEIEAPLFEMPYSNTGSIKIYSGDKGGPVLKVTGKIGVDDPVAVRRLLALDSLVDMYKAATRAEQVPAELVRIDERYRAKRTQELRALAEVDARSNPAPVAVMEKSYASFNATVCKTFPGSGGASYVPVDCHYSTNSWLALSTVQQAGPYDWIFGWNEQTWGPAAIELINQLGIPPNEPGRLIDTFGGYCTLQPQMWGYCSWGGSFTGKWAAVTNYFAKPHLPGSAPGLGVTIHDYRPRPPR